MRVLDYLKSRLWLALGLASFVSLTVYSIAGTLALGGFGSFSQLLGLLFVIIEWCTACVIYFFIGAMFGHIADMILAWRRKRTLRTPLWFWLTIALWAVTILALLVIHSRYVDPVLVWIFPLAFGIFFTSYAFTMIVPKAVASSAIAKFAFDMLFLGAFGAWLYMTLAYKKRYKSALRVLIAAIFLVFFLGFVGCAASLA